jgi:predicted DNA-binding protein (MmcQ/YjbR family)
MDIETIREICQKLTATTEDIKWEHDLVFSVGAKMFCVVGLDQTPTSASFKVTEDQFEEISHQVGFKPAPYAARYHWVLIDDISRMKKAAWEKHLQQSYQLVQEKLTIKLRKQLGIL